MRDVPGGVMSNKYTVTREPQQYAPGKYFLPQVVYSERRAVKVVEDMQAFDPDGVNNGNYTITGPERKSNAGTN